MSVEDVCNYLQSIGFVSKKHIPLHSRWVSQFLQFSNSRSDLMPPEQQMQDYLSGIEKRCEQWQIDQACAGEVIGPLTNRTNFPYVCPGSQQPPQEQELVIQRTANRAALRHRELEAHIGYRKCLFSRKVILL